MKKHYAAWLVASVLSSASGAGPNPSLGDQANLLDRLVGTWDVDYTDYLKDGTTLRRTGEFTVGWIMDGRAIQDVWIVDPWGTHVEREVYTEVHDLGGKDTRWSFSDIRPDSFQWRDETSSDGGKTWSLHSDYHMKRHGAISP